MRQRSIWVVAAASRMISSRLDLSGVARFEPRAKERREDERQIAKSPKEVERV
jgi:hypothetical protein